MSKISLPLAVILIIVVSVYSFTTTPEVTGTDNETQGTKQEETEIQEETEVRKEEECGTQSIQCICGIGETRKTITVTQKLIRNNSTGSNETECIALSDPYQTCANYSCFLAPNQTTTTPDYSPSKVKKNIVESFYPKEFTIPRGEGQRFTRQSDPCFIPPLKNAEIKCWKWPNWMNCDIKCVYGYALQEKKDTVSTININCRNTENVWKPHGFQDCEPFVNCKAHLVKPGDLKCKEPKTGPSYCEISCLDYDQYEATSKQKYECLDDSFARTLPHCAVLKDVPLVKKPK